MRRCNARSSARVWRRPLIGSTANGGAFLTFVWSAGAPTTAREGACAPPRSSGGEGEEGTARDSALACLRLFMGTGGDSFDAVNELVGFERFAVNFVEGGDVRVPFQQGGRFPREGDGLGGELPDRFDDRMVVRIQNIFPIARVARDVDLRDPFH